MNNKIRNALIIWALLSLILSASLSSDPLSRTEEPEKLTVNGYCYVTLYLNGYIELSRSGNPLIGQNVYMNSKKLSHQGGGKYSGAIISSPYAPAIGNRIRIKLKPVLGRVLTPGKTQLTQEVILGNYTLNSYVKWTYPADGAVISLKNPGAFTQAKSLKFTWDHFGTPFRSRVKIRNMTHNREVFNRVVPASAGEISVPAILIQKGNRYQFHIGSDNPLGKFKLTEHVDKRSRIEFFYTDVIYANVK